jgi:hypothetical protein
MKVAVVGVGATSWPGRPRPDRSDASATSLSTNKSQVGYRNSHKKSGANNPGSGNLPLSCDDGGFDDAYSADIKFETGGFYCTVAWELHKNVNRNSDGIGSNSPYYNALFLNKSTLLDFATFNGYVAEIPGYATVATPGYLTDIGDEKALKVGAQYRFPFNLTVSAMWEEMKRDIPAALKFQNERQRNGTWVALSQDLNDRKDRISVGWAHAGATPGDPGGQHNYNPTLDGNDQANMYTVAWTHQRAPRPGADATPWASRQDWITSSDPG